MRRIATILVLLLANFTVYPTQPPAQTQAVPLSEISGAVNIGKDRVLLIADEGYHVEIVSNAAATFADPQTFKSNMRPLSAAMNGSKESKKKVDDLEDIAWDDARQMAFVITSHSRSKSQDAVADPKADKPQRHKLARLILKDGDIDPPHKEIDVLEEALKKFPFVIEAMKRPHQEGGNTGTFNIEGLAFDQRTGSLLIGLRSPAQEQKGKTRAVVLVLKNPHELFDKSAPPEFDPAPKYLDLGGLGIRGMTYDAKREGCWIVAGRSADPDTPSDQIFSSLWFWDPKKPDKPPKKAKTEPFTLENLESVCLLDRDKKGGLLLISDDGGDSDSSRYLWIPIPELAKSK